MQWLGRGAFILAAVCATAAPAEAQTRLGVRGGVSRAEVTGQDLGEVSRQTGFTAGAFADLAAGELLGIDVGLSYTQKGLATLANGIDLSVELDYLELPVLARLTLLRSGRVQPVLYAGPVVSLRVRCHADAVQGPFVVEAECSDAGFEGSLETNDLDFGALFGAGAWFGVGDRWQLHVDAMYNLGLRTIDPDTVVEIDKNRAVLFRAGVSIALGR